MAMNMNWIKDRRHLLLMWILAIGVMSVLPFLSHEAVSKVLTGSPLYRLSWSLIATTKLAQGDRIARERAELRLVYLNNDVDTTPPPFDWYAEKEKCRESILLREDFSPAPSLDAPSDGAIVPVSVKSEYAEGLKLGMRMGLERSRAQTSQPVRDSGQQNVIGHGSGSQKSPKMLPPQQTNVSSSSQVTDSKQPAKESLVVVLKSMVPSQDKKSTVLYVLVAGPDRDRLNELTWADYVPSMLPADQNLSARLGDDDRGGSAKRENPISDDLAKHTPCSPRQGRLYSIDR